MSKYELVINLKTANGIVDLLKLSSHLFGFRGCGRWSTSKVASGTIASR
jgi:hypothetical protein